MMGRPLAPSADTASILILIGIILQTIEIVILFGVGFFLIYFPALELIVLTIGVVGVFWVALVYLFSYRRTRDGNYSGARTPTLVFGILSILTLGLISGILYIIAYVKLGDAEREATPPPPVWGPVAPLNPGWRYCPACGRPTPAAGGFCQSCGARLA